MTSTLGRATPFLRGGSPRARRAGFLFVVLLAASLAGCASGPAYQGDDFKSLREAESGPLYEIGPGDNLRIFVWENPELSVTIPVRPDGHINTPLVEDLQAAGRTPTGLARDLEQSLSKYVRNPVVTVIVSGFVGQPDAQIRVVGEATEPQALLYRERMTLLDVMIAVGGLTEFAAGNRAQLIREVAGERQSQTVRLDDLVRGGDIDADVAVRPGDILIIPEAWF